VQYDLIIIRYGEIWLKAKETRKRFEQTLINKIRNVFNQTVPFEKITRERGRIYLKTPYINESIPILQKIFGLTSISPAVLSTSDLESMSNTARTTAKEVITKNTSFALRVTRTGTHPYTSQEVAQRIGEQIVQQYHAPVNLTSPNIELYIEIRDKQSYFFLEKIQGTGGLPYGTQGNVTALIDTPSSLLAAWYLMRRGCVVHFILTNPKLEHRLREFMKTWFIDIPIHTVIDTKELNRKVSSIVEKTKSNALVTGHILENQKLEPIIEITRLKQKSKIPLLSPLISMSKDELQLKCQSVGISI
jgi:thiamine biosynthesis protein ThiI